MTEEDTKIIPRTIKLSCDCDVTKSCPQGRFGSAPRCYIFLTPAYLMEQLDVIMKEMK